MNQEQAEKRVEELQEYYAHIGTYVSVNLFLMAINYMTHSEEGDSILY